MNFKSVFLVFFLFSAFVLSGQTIKYPDGKDVRTKKNDNVDGSPYLIEGWCKGSAVDSEGNITEDMLLRYNMAQDAFETEINKKLIEMNKYKYVDFKFVHVDENFNEVEYHMANGLVENDFGYYQVIYNGDKSLFLKKTDCKLVEKEGTAYASSSGTFKYYTKTNYYIRFNGKLHKVKKNSKSIVAALGKNKSFERYLKKKKMKLKNDLEIITALEYFETMD